VRRALPLLLAIGAFVLATLLWISGSRTGSHVFDRDSASNTSPNGLSLAYAYLGRRQGQTVKMLTTPLRSGVVPSNAVVIRVEEHDLDKKQVVERDDDDDEPATKVPQSFLTSAEDEFVRGGGRLVLASNDPRGSLAVRNDAGKVAAKVFPIWPGLDTLALPEPRGLAPRSLPSGMHTLFAANGEAVVARQEIGAGDVIVVSVPEMFENENIASGHHLQLLLAIAAEPAAVQPAGRQRYAGRPVYFDEVVHGMAASDGMLAILTDWRLGPLLVLLFIAALLTLWRNSKRVGPAEDEDRDTRSDAIDLVASLGALYGRSMSSAESIALYHAALERSVAAQSGLRGDALHKRVAELTHGFTPSASVTPMPAHAFQQHLTIINDAFRTLERSARGGHDANHR
jgi:hypothetical protein